MKVEGSIIAAGVAGIAAAAGSTYWNASLPKKSEANHWGGGLERPINQFITVVIGGSAIALPMEFQFRHPIAKISAGIGAGAIAGVALVHLADL